MRSKRKFLVLVAGTRGLGPPRLATARRPTVARKRSTIRRSRSKCPGGRVGNHQKSRVHALPEKVPATRPLNGVCREFVRKSGLSRGLGRIGTENRSKRLALRTPAITDRPLAVCRGVGGCARQ